MVWSLALCPDDAKQYQVMQGAEFVWNSVPDEGSVYYSRPPIASVFTIRVLRENPTFDWS